MHVHEKCTCIYCTKLFLDCVVVNESTTNDSCRVSSLFLVLLRDFALFCSRQ